jgi:hypothetical protein
VIKVLAPGVKNGREADVSAKMLGLGRDRRQCLRCRREQKAVNLGLVLVCMVRPRAARGRRLVWGVWSCIYVSDL